MEAPSLAEQGAAQATAQGRQGVKDYLNDSDSPSQGVRQYPVLGHHRMNRWPSGTLIRPSQERILIQCHRLFGGRTFDLAEAQVDALRPYVIRDGLNELASLGLVRAFPETKNVWEFTEEGTALAKILTNIQDRLLQMDEETTRRQWAKPTLTKVFKGDRDWHMRTIPEFIESIKTGDFDPTEGTGEDDFTGAFYADTKYRTPLKVDIQAMVNGTWDQRWTHVFLTWNSEDK
jgi:DNA-binding HxlR family transcriptional regulator